MLTENDILATLNNVHKQGYYCHFIDLGHVYSYLIDCRLNVFRGPSDEWAIAAERLGYNPRAGAICLEIYYYGNCLVNREHYNGQSTNYYHVYPIDWDNFAESMEGETILPTATHWNVRG